MRRLVSFSLYGANPKYTVNAVANAMLAPVVYPGWICRFHVDDTVPRAATEALRSLPWVEVVDERRHTDARGMFWRFLPAAEPDLDALIVRDTDSWLSRREAACVEDWLDSGRDFHIMRDHCYHSFPIMGGLWGVRGGVIPGLPAAIERHEGSFDQAFLAEYVYPLSRGRALVHRGEQRDARGEPTDYFGDGAVPMPAYLELDEAVAGLSFLEAHQQNAFHCAHCGRTHDTYVGAMFDRIPERALGAVRSVVEQAGIASASFPGLGAAAACAPVAMESEPSRPDPAPTAAHVREEGEGAPITPEQDALSEAEETIGWLTAQLDHEAAEVERLALKLRAAERQVRVLESRLAEHLRPYAAFPGGCGVDVVCLTHGGGVPPLAADFALAGRRVFVVDVGGDAATEPATLPRFVARVSLPAVDGEAMGPQLAALDELSRRAAIGRVIAVVDDPGLAPLAIAAQTSFAWKLVYLEHGGGSGHARLAAGCDLLLPVGASAARIDELLASWYPKVALIVVSFDNHDYLRLCLESAFTQSLYPNLEVVVVENGTSPAWLEAWREDEPRLRALPAHGNVGFAAACNRGVAACPDAHAVVFANDDVVFTRGWLGGLVRHLRDERIGEIGPVTNYAGNAARIEVDYDDLPGMHRFAARIAETRAGELAELPMLPMFCTALRSAVLAEVGPLDEGFAVGMYEDDDYAMRLRAAGYRVACARDVFVHHWGGASFRRLDEATHAAVHASHGQTFAQRWRRSSAAAEPELRPRPRDRAGSLRAFAAQLARRYGVERVAILDPGGLREPAAWRPAAVVTGADEAELAQAVDAVGAAVAFSGRVDGEPVVVAADPFRFDPPPGFALTAFVPVFNEADLLEASVAHLLAEGASVHLLDTWSTDGSFELARELARHPRVGVERFPVGGPPGAYDWSGILGRIESLAAARADGWAILSDADEFRSAPWPRRSLREALWAVEQAGFDAVDHTVLSFPPVDNEFVPGDDPTQHFRHAELWTGPGFAPQIKAWRRRGRPVCLAASGGHEAEFERRRLFPFNFLSRHYPIRSQPHGERKVFGERVPRWSAEERARGWHAQYDALRPGHCFLRRPEELEEFNDAFRRDHLLELLARVGVGAAPTLTVR